MAQPPREEDLADELHKLVKSGSRGRAEQGSHGAKIASFFLAEASAHCALEAGKPRVAVAASPYLQIRQSP